MPILMGVALFVALAQQPQQAPPPKMSVEVKLVLISATVRDKHGKNVPGLNKDDFVFHVDGHLRPINDVIHESDLPLTLGLIVQTSLGPRQRYALHNVSDAGYGSWITCCAKTKTKRSWFVLARRSNCCKVLPLLARSSAPRSSSCKRPNSGVEGTAGTLLYDAVCFASNQLMKTQQGHMALFVLSDGIDRGSKETLEDAVEAAQRADTSVYSILLTENWPGPNGKKILERISTETGGRMFKVSHELTVAQVYAQAEGGIEEPIHAELYTDWDGCERGLSQNPSHDEGKGLGG